MDSPLTTQTALLWALGQGPAHGAELAARLRDRSRGAIVIPDGTLYPALRALVTEQLAHETHGEGARRRFELTETGQARLAQASGIITALFGKRRRKAAA